MLTIPAPSRVDLCFVGDPGGNLMYNPGCSTGSKCTPAVPVAMCVQVGDT